MKTKLEQLREKIIEAVPEIMELKFGCKTDEGTILRITPIRGWKYTVLRKDGTIMGQNYFGNEILGRDITLEDVMITVEETGLSFRYFYKDTLHIQIEKGGRLLGTWQLNIHLQDQSQETIDYLYELIVNKK